MLEYDRIDISEGIDIKKCKETSRECNLCKFYYYLDKDFNYGPYLCNGCYDMSFKAVSIKNLAITNQNGNHYRVNFAFISKKDVYNTIELIFLKALILKNVKKRVNFAFISKKVLR